MGAILYFIPGVTSAPIELVEKRGIVGIFDQGKAPAFAGPITGPDGLSGMLVSTDVEGLRYSKASQTWVKATRGDFWIGYWTVLPPGPADLARKEMYFGHAVRLADGNDWIIPIARSFARGSSLPMSMSLSPDGKWVGAPAPEYRALCEAAAEFADEILAHVAPADDDDAPETFSFTVPYECDRAVEALAVNYRLDRDEVAALALLRQTTADEIMRALIDWPFVMATVKKNLQSASSNGGGGSPGTSPATAPVSVN
ncbi:MAG TPA: hypothetical protein VFH53_06170 [Phycisphaerae bacterium]|nr:hypothetical protein [Phycisphaerae bacterium]